MSKLSKLLRLLNCYTNKPTNTLICQNTIGVIQTTNSTFTYLEIDRVCGQIKYEWIQVFSFDQ
jgi:hypothetical protein